MSLAESGRWTEPIVQGPQDATLRLRPTGAVLFATLDLSRPVLVRTIGTWPSADMSGSRRRGPAAGIASAASRCVSWLLGR